MALRESTACTRELGAELRRVRERARYTGVELAKKLGWSQSKVSRMETGDRTVTEVDAAIYLAFCGAVGDELNEILNLTRDGDDDYWLHARGDRLPDELRSLIVQENTAEILVKYDLMVVPGLAQTEDYARVLFHESAMVAKEHIESRVRIRMDRQQMLRRQEPPKITFYVHENVLRTRVGSNQTMQEQMLHLLFLSAASACTVRVVPASASARMGTCGSFTWMAHHEHNPVIYVEHLTTSLFLEGREDMLAYRRMVDRLNVLALDEGQSGEFLASLASEYDREEGRA